MSTHTLPELEALISRLSPAEQLRLLEDLARRLRTRMAGDEQALTEALGPELAIMARDRDVQSEIAETDRMLQS